MAGGIVMLLDSWQLSRKVILPALATAMRPLTRSMGIAVRAGALHFAASNALTTRAPRACG